MGHRRKISGNACHILARGGTDCRSSAAVTGPMRAGRCLIHRTPPTLDRTADPAPCSIVRKDLYQLHGPAMSIKALTVVKTAPQRTGISLGNTLYL